MALYSCRDGQWIQAILALIIPCPLPILKQVCAVKSLMKKSCGATVLGGRENHQMPESATICLIISGTMMLGGIKFEVRQTMLLISNSLRRKRHFCFGANPYAIGRRGLRRNRNVWRVASSELSHFKLESTPPNKSPEPTAVGAVSSAIAVHVASRRWLSFFR